MTTSTKHTDHTIISLRQLATQGRGEHDYDPNSMTVEKAREYIRQFLAPLSETETVGLHQAYHRVLAEDITSNLDVPGYDNSAMDGYAFRSEDIAADGRAAELRLVGKAFAGQPFNGHINSGECVRIMTGAKVPAGADTVVMQEWVHADGERVFINTWPKPKANVRYKGEDILKDAVVLGRGHKCQAADLGLLASLGVGQVSVYRRLRVAFFSTGDELVGVGQPLSDGQIYDSNRYSLFGMLAGLPVDITDLGAIPDDPERLEVTLLTAAAEADVVITSGGVSVGEADYMKTLLAKHGNVLFWKIAMKPGRPLAYGKIGKAHYFGLPGNPVAVMVTFYQFVREALWILMGQISPPVIPMLTVRCSQPIRKLPGRTEFVRAILTSTQEGDWTVAPTGNQSSGVLSSMSRANCFIVLDDVSGNVEAGSLVRVQLFEGVL